MTSARIFQYEPQVHRHLLPDIVNLHARCIEFDGALLRFHPPFSEEKKRKMQSFWEERLGRIERGLSICFIYSILENGKEEIGGTAELGMPAAETGPFRGDVEMLMVSPNHRRKGISKLLMFELERVAQEKGRTLLQLGTTAGSAAAEFLYPSLGYVKYGTVPNYGITPGTGALVDGEYFYKDLRRTSN